MGHAWQSISTAHMLLLARDAATDLPHPAGIRRERADEHGCSFVLYACCHAHGYSFVLRACCRARLASYPHAGTAVPEETTSACAT
jgi:hypothetical protein